MNELDVFLGVFFGGQRIRNQPKRPINHFPSHPRMVFTYIYHKNQLNVGKYTKHGCYGFDDQRRIHHGVCSLKGISCVKGPTQRTFYPFQDSTTSGDCTCSNLRCQLQENAPGPWIMNVLLEILANFHAKWQYVAKPFWTSKNLDRGEIMISWCCHFPLVSSILISFDRKVIFWFFQANIQSHLTPKQYQSSFLKID